ncbi:SIMPL domain-containing protein [Solimicrobium silvestre]|uniref:SIMPL domain-containing protein n=1 Tax=Solimicrobium silvestre TaxID=2099400 RepID=A0A2S9H1P4_9BURK|nr:SIMPL domain-containing protein [Solimicrobium silvestre]PRC93786.1 hypothetical protein S2091_1395 [Solimicrobium silvestre]
MLKHFFIFCMLLGSATIVCASQLPDYPFIHSVGNAGIYAQPDIGEISFEITVSDAESDKATQQAVAINADILALLAAQNIPAADVEIYEVQKKMRAVEGVDGKPATVICDIKQSIIINVRDLSKWEGLTTPLLGTNNLGNFDTSFERTDRHKINDELIAAAVKDAQHNGMLMVESFGKHLGAAMAISSGKLKDVSIALGLATGGLSSDDAPKGNPIRNFFAPAPLRFTQSVDVLFKIK